MSANIQYNYCPNCGYLLSDGMCANCGTKIAIPKINEDNKKTKDIYGTVYEHSEKGPDRDGNVIAVVLGLLAALFIFLFAVIIQVGYKGVLKSIPEMTPENLSIQSGYTGLISDYFKIYKSSLEDEGYTALQSDPYDYLDEPYYYFDNCVNLESGYTPVKKIWTYSNENGWFDEAGGEFPRDLYIYCEYVTFMNTPFDSEKMDYNLYFFSTDIAHIYEDMDYECQENEGIYLEGDVYVTYMDDEVASLLYFYSGYKVDDVTKDDAKYSAFWTELISVNVNMKTGEILKLNDVYNTGNDFLDVMISEADFQNSGENLILDYYDRDVLEQMISKGTILWFYTPLGVEYGVSLPDGTGYVTYTQFDRTRFAR